MAHAFYHAGPIEEGLIRARAFGSDELGIKPASVDVVELRYGLFPVEGARQIADHASHASVEGAHRLIIIATERFFHEAQNALLKVFEEPPAGITLILVVPSSGILLPTLRSRLAPLPTEDVPKSVPNTSAAFIEATPAEREKMIAKLLDRTKSDKDEEKQAARSEAVRLIEGLIATAYAKGRDDTEIRRFLTELNRFLPMLHERSAPLKLIFEHILITMPRSL